MLARMSKFFCDWEELADFFGRDYRTLCSHFQQAVVSLTSRFGALLDVMRSIERFRKRAAGYKAFIACDLRDRFQYEFVEYFSGVALFLDGMRQPIARPKDKDIQNCTWSRYVKDNCLLYGVYATVDGLVLGLTEPLTGRHTDKEFVTDLHAHRLRMFGMPVLCDSIFTWK